MADHHDVAFLFAAAAVSASWFVGCRARRRPRRPAHRRYLPTGAAAAPGAPRVKLVSYNVLGEGYLESDDDMRRYVNDITGATAADVAWRSRLPRIVAEVGLYAADVLCLQEVEDAAFHRDFVPALARHGYQPAGFLAVRQRRSNGVAIFCKGSMRVIRTRSLLYREEVAALLPEASGRLGRGA